MNPQSVRSNSRLPSATMLLDPVAVLAFQISHTSAARLLPEVSLMAAVLEDAVHCIQKNRHAQRGRPRREFLDACRWVFDGERHWPFAFENVCDTLGLSAGAVRRAVGELLVNAKVPTGQQAAA